MRLLTFQATPGEAHVGALKGDSIVDLTPFLVRSMGRDPLTADMQFLIELGKEGLRLAQEVISISDPDLEALGALVPFEFERLLAPIPRPRKNIMCLGRNYPEHATEAVRMFGEAPYEVPEYPTIFTKAPTAVNSPSGEIPYDSAVSTRIDWEGELAFVIGRGGKNIKRSDALGHIFGYTIINDISARDIQKRHGGQNFKGKSLDGSCPMGPWIVTADEIPDPANLEIRTRVNGVEKQYGNTSDMIFDVPSIIEHLSLGLTLEPGDVVATGTPAGVGNARTPPEFLKPGDIVEVEIQSIGVIRNRIVGQ